jgi:hypothetical protein
MSNVLKYASLAAAMSVMQACSQVPTNKTSDPTANFV